jgi:hypothetical protein
MVARQGSLGSREASVLAFLLRDQCGELCGPSELEDILVDGERKEAQRLLRAL